ncbi:MAG: hypothetical protein Q7R61_01250 [bacterium]|nr:hypothetical protein [bacterium]
MIKFDLFTMNDISKKFFIWGIAGLVILRFLMVFFLMNNIPFTDMGDDGFRPNFSGSYVPDEVNYFNLAQSLTKFSPVTNVANVGYPLFLAPIVYLTGANSPIDIVKIVFIIQAFLFFSLAIILTGLVSFEIFKNRKLSLVAAAMFTVYPYILFAILKLANFPRAIPAFHYQMWINIGADYLSAILVYFGFYLFIKRYNTGNINLVFASAIGVIIAAAALVRVANILYLPLIFLILIWIKKYRASIGFGVAAFLVYLPQWVYNFYFFGSPLTYGYRIPSIGFDSGSEIIGDWLSFENLSIFFEKIWLNLPILVFILPIMILIVAAGFWRVFIREKIIGFTLAFWIILDVGFYMFFIAAASQLRYFIPSIAPLIILFIAGVIKIYEFRRSI